MTRILIAISLIATLSSSAQAEIYARWEYHDVGAHQLPFELGGPGQTADFSGIVGGRGDHEALVFNVHTGELVTVADDPPAVRDIAGTYAVVTDWQSPTVNRLYDAATGTFLDLVPPEGAESLELFAASSSGRAVAVVSRRNEFDFRWHSLVIYEDGQLTAEIDPPFVHDPFPGSGLTFPTGELIPGAMSDNGRFVIGGYSANGENGGFVVDLETQEFIDITSDGGGYRAVANNGLALGGVQLPDIRRYTGQYPDTDLAAINSAGQAVMALAIDDAGRILQIAPGDVVRYEYEPGNFIDVQLKKLVIGLPLFIAGDYNADGGVAQPDLDLVLTNWGNPFDGIEGSWLHDVPTGGNIDQRWLDQVLARWGRGDGVLAADMPLALTAAGVPEPSTLWLLAIGGLLLAERMTRDRSRDE